jgi:hypothetical protein
MQVLEHGSAELKCNSFTLILGGGEGGVTDLLDLKMKVQRNTLPKFLDMLPVLIQRRYWKMDKIKFHIDTPVDISHMIKGETPRRDETIELSSNRLEVMVDGDDMTFSIRGYPHAVKLHVDTYVKRVMELYSTMNSAEIFVIRPFIGTATKSSEPVKGCGVKLPNWYPGTLIAVVRNKTCLISHYACSGKERNKYTQHRGNLPTKTLVMLDGTWEMCRTAMFNETEIYRLAEEFTLPNFI